VERTVVFGPDARRWRPPHGGRFGCASARLTDDAGCSRCPLAPSGAIADPSLQGHNAGRIPRASSAGGGPWGAPPETCRTLRLVTAHHWRPSACCCGLGRLDGSRREDLRGPAWSYAPTRRRDPEGLRRASVPAVGGVVRRPWLPSRQRGAVQARRMGAARSGSVADVAQSRAPRRWLFGCQDGHRAAAASTQRVDTDPIAGGVPLSSVVNTGLIRRGEGECHPAVSPGSITPR
jgi:hypothetical protein